MPCISVSIFSKFFGRRQKLESTVDLTSDVVFKCDFKLSLQKYNVRYILSLLNASLLVHQLFSTKISLSLSVTCNDNEDLLLAL